MPRHLPGGGNVSFKKLKISHFLTHFSPPNIQILIKIRTGSEYFTLCESFAAKKAVGTPYLFAGQPFTIQTSE